MKEKQVERRLKPGSVMVVKGKHRWCLFAKASQLAWVGDEPGLTRWRILQTPWFGVIVHRINHRDGERHLHDHPWHFISLVLRGGYDEIVSVSGFEDDVLKPESRSTIKSRKPLRIHRHPLSRYHTIQRLRGKCSWSLVLAGPYRQPWGYATESGWVEASAYGERGPEEWGHQLGNHEIDAIGFIHNDAEQV